MLSTFYHHRRTILFALIISIILGGVGLYTVNAQSNATNKVIIYLFWGDGCPHCAKKKPFLEEMAAQNPNIEVRAFEIWSMNPTG